MNLNDFDTIYCKHLYVSNGHGLNFIGFFPVSNDNLYFLSGRKINFAS
jgi:hypothetical protein